jgi:small conductance mechanosensitive channel
MSLIFFLCFQMLAQLLPPEPTPSPGLTEFSVPDQNVQVTKSPTDQQIASRIQKILEVTKWFNNLSVECREGVVVLKGRAKQKSHSEWAEKLAQNTEGVVAVLNNFDVKTADWFDLAPAKAEAENLIRKTLGYTPYFLASILVFALFIFLAVFVQRLGRRTAEKRVQNPLLIELVAKLFALPVLILGIYLVLKISGLTGMALTILGGTGALGLIVGFAMKNILENYFSGIMLSLRNPYTTGDIVEIGGKQGVVQKLTTRGTILVDFDGNHIIIPNTIIYGNLIVNLTANPSIRIKFKINIPHDDDIAKTRQVIMKVLRSVPEILTKPEPLTLVEEFVPNEIVFQVYFWIDSKKTSYTRIRSLVMELVKNALSDSRKIVPRPILETKNESGALLNEASRGRHMDQGKDLT